MKLFIVTIKADVGMLTNTSEEMEKRLIEEEKRPTADNSVILYLVSKGAKANIQDTYGCTPLHYAAMRGNEVAAVQLLTLADIDTDINDNELMTPLHLACAHGHFEIAKLLLNKSTDMFNQEETGCIPVSNQSLHLLLTICISYTDNINI